MIVSTSSVILHFTDLLNLVHEFTKREDCVVQTLYLKMGETIEMDMATALGEWKILIQTF